MAGKGEEKDKGGGKGKEEASVSATFKTLCSECMTEMECDTDVKDAFTSCPYCWLTFLATPKASPPNGNSFKNQSTPDHILEPHKLADHPSSSSPAANRTSGVTVDQQSRKVPPSSDIGDQQWTGFHSCFDFRSLLEKLASGSSDRAHSMPGMTGQTSRQVQPSLSPYLSALVHGKKRESSTRGRQTPIRKVAASRRPLPVTQAAPPRLHLSTSPQNPTNKPQDFTSAGSNLLLKDEKKTPTESTISSNKPSTGSAELEASSSRPFETELNTEQLVDAPKDEQTTTDTKDNSEDVDSKVE